MAEATCAIDGCERPVSKRGWCNAHYLRWYRHGDPLAGGAPRLADKVCSVEGCERRHYARGWCSSHWQKWRTHGDPLKDGYHRGPRVLFREACIVQGCPGLRWSKGLCRSCYFRSASKVRRARQLAVETETIISMVVFERDAWTCHICGRPIDPAVRHPDGMSASVDHVVPLVKGGPHLYSNVAAAHLRCNIQKKDKVA